MHPADDRSLGDYSESLRRSEGGGSSHRRSDGGGGSMRRGSMVSRADRGLFASSSSDALAPFAGPTAERARVPLEMAHHRARREVVDLVELHDGGIRPHHRIVSTELNSCCPHACGPPTNSSPFAWGPKYFRPRRSCESLSDQHASCCTSNDFLLARAQFHLMFFSRAVEPFKIAFLPVQSL